MSVAKQFPEALSADIRIGERPGESLLGKLLGNGFWKVVEPRENARTYPGNWIRATKRPGASTVLFNPDHNAKWVDVVSNLAHEMQHVRDFNTDPQTLFAEQALPYSERPHEQRAFATGNPYRSAYRDIQLRDPDFYRSQVASPRALELAETFLRNVPPKRPR